MAEQQHQSIGQRHWTETFFAVAALFVSAVSLWVALRTEQANEKLVAASTWPYLYTESSDANPDGSKAIYMDVTNSGVGPAKAESFEVFWNGRAWPSADALMRACCGYKPFNPGTDLEGKRTLMLTGGVQGTVIRAGEVRNFLRVPLGPDNADVWQALDRARHKMNYRICYCSVFDECWIGTFGGILPLTDQLRPERVKTCPVPKVAFLQ